MFAEFHGYETTLYSTRMIRTADWKYVYNPATEDELYDLRSDPGELHNLAPMVAFGHVLRRMKARLLARMRATGDSLATENAWQANSYDLFLSAPRTLTLTHVETTGVTRHVRSVSFPELLRHVRLTLTRTYDVYTVAA